MKTQSVLVASLFILSCSKDDATSSDSGDSVSDTGDIVSDSGTSPEPSTFYLDADGDGYGTEESIEAEEVPEGYASESGDCDDTDPMINPGMEEDCDGIDNDCNEVIDDEGTCIDGVNTCEGELGLGGHAYKVNTDVVVNLLDYGPAEMWNLGDATDAFNDALAAIPDETGGILLVPPGRYKISNTVLIDRGAPIHIAGVGSSRYTRGSMIEWTGPNDRPMFRILGSSDSIIEGLSLVTGNGVSAGIQVETRDDRVPCRLSFRRVNVSSNNKLFYTCEDGEPCEDPIITGGTLTWVDSEDPVSVVPGLPFGFRFLAGDAVDCAGDAPGDEDGCDGPDRGNGLHFFQSCEANGYGEAAFAFAQSSSNDNVLVHSHGYSGIIKTFPVSPADAFLDTSFYSTVPASGQGMGGSFRSYTTGTARNDQDVRLVASTSPVWIQGVDSEYSRHALVAEGGGESAPVHYISNRKQGPGSTSPWPQPPTFKFHLDGELNIKGAIIHRDAGEPIVEASSGQISVTGLDVRYESDDCLNEGWNIFDATEDVETLAYANAAQKQPWVGCSIGFLAVGDPANGTTPETIGPTEVIKAVEPGPNLLALMANHPDSQRMIAHVDDFGATPNDDTDDTAAFKAAVEHLSLSPAQAGGLVLGTGVYDISDTIEIEMPAPPLGYFGMSGTSSKDTIIQWHGDYDPEVAALKFIGLMNPYISGFTIRPANGQELGAGIIASTDEILGGGSSHTYFDVIVDGTGGTLDYGFRVVPGESTSSPGTYYDQNGEWHLYQQCHAIGYQRAGYTVEHSQAKTNLYLNSWFDGKGVGEMGVTTVGSDAVTPSGSFSWIGGGGGNNHYTDFGLGGSVDFISVSQGEFTESPRLMDNFCGNSGSNYSISLFNNSWSSPDVERGWWQWPSAVGACVEPAYYDYESRVPNVSCITKFGTAGPSLFYNNLIDTEEPDAKICQHAWSLGGNHILSVVNNDTTAAGSASTAWIYDNGSDFPESLGVLEFVEVLNSARDENGAVVNQ